MLLDLLGANPNQALLAGSGTFSSLGSINKVGIPSVRKRTNSCSVRFVAFFRKVWSDVHQI